jgi:uncharacterized protein involved in tellurium resistance
VQREEEDEDGDAVDGDWGESLAPGEALLDKIHRHLVFAKIYK